MLDRGLPKLAIQPLVVDHKVAVGEGLESELVAAVSVAMLVQIGRNGVVIRWIVVVKVLVRSNTAAAHKVGRVEERVSEVASTANQMTVALTARYQVVKAQVVGPTLRYLVFDAR